MNAPAVAETDPKRRDCACPEEEAPLCELECPTRPRFYCGQLLSDAQLNALVRWTEDRLALVRYRAGWGVACGLAVRRDPRCCTRVVIEPGYAVSCCGDDLVLCEPACLDLDKACRERCDPHAEPEPCDEDDEVCWLAGEKVPRRQLRTVDITVGRGETPIASEPISGGCGCSRACEPAPDDEEEACAHTAIKEAATVSWRPVVAGDDPERRALDRWVESYQKCAQVVRRFQAGFDDLERLASYDGRDELARRIREWLVGWLTRSPLHEFCFVEERIRRASKEELLNRDWLAEILFFIVQDCRNHHLLCDCHACTEDDVVRLARVWLLAGTDEYGRRTCRILYIEPRPPHRRPLGRDCPPIARHCVNAAALALWRHPDEACVALTDAGIGVRERQEVVVPTSPGDLWKLLDCPPLLRCGEEVVLQVLDHCLFGGRVVGWCGDGRKPEPPYEPKPEPPYEPKPEPPYEKEESYAGPRPEPSREDDLTVIDGIGSSRAERCKARGITTYAALAKVSLEELRSLLGIPEDTARAILEAARQRAGGGEGGAEP